MAEMTRLLAHEVASMLESLRHWSIRDGKLTRTFKFPNFVSAFGFMTKVALIAEAMGHHPEWFNVFDTVRIELSSHEVGGLSKNDFDLADKIDQLT
jgi:4a-hydroxytetrahydrobiopterin dehydratase